ncbi:MAG: 23S rRNA pseudouridine(1911/1915/1917) synthase RluD [Acidiferrobacteraceae bacterium]
MGGHGLPRHLSVPIAADMAGHRLDAALASLLPEFSRSQLQAWIREGRVRLNGTTVPPRYRLAGGEQVEIEVLDEARGDWGPENLPLAVVEEDEHVIVIDKPAGLVVHPGAGNGRGTLLNALLHHCSELARLPRAGIVHRLDKDTSGLLVVAKREPVRLDLIRQLRERQVSRVYRALVHGRMVAGGHVDAPIGRHPRDRLRMAVVAHGRPAVTHYRVRSRYAHHTELEVRLESGRTHQIRVHMSHLRHPIVGDPLYTGRAAAVRGAPELTARVRAFPRQALHAEVLSFEHPVRGKATYHAPLPADLASLIDDLRRHAEVDL